MVKRMITVSFIALLVMSFMIIGLAENSITWEEKASLSSPRTGLSSISLDGNIYCLGGVTANNGYLNILEVYNPLSDTWTEKSPMSVARRSFGVTSYNGKIYVFGGKSNGVYTNSVEEYNLQTNTWISKSDMPIAREFCKAITVNDKIYIIGGRSSDGHSNEVVEYDPKTDTYETKESMPVALISFSITLVDSDIYVVGGEFNSDPFGSNKVYKYSTQSDSWSTASSNMISDTNSHAILTYGNFIYSIFGISREVGVKGIEVYDYNNDSWSQVNLSEEYYARYFGCTLINNDVYVMGGRVHSSSSNSSISDRMIKISLPTLVIASPTNLTATANNAQINLNWGAVEGATSYNVKRSITQGGPYTTIGENVTGTSYIDSSVAYGITYYYVVTANDANGESENSNEASATPVAPVLNRALLHITMQNGFIKEYDMSMSEIDTFIAWYNGSGSNLFTITKHNNIGPFLNRKDYLVKDKIMYFEVMEYEGN